VNLRVAQFVESLFGLAKEPLAYQKNSAELSLLANYEFPWIALCSLLCSIPRVKLTNAVRKQTN
jgi:hypothetical protein